MRMIPLNSPELRSDILAEVVRQLARIPGPATYHAVFKAVLDAIGQPEEVVGFDIEAAVTMLIFARLVECNQFDGFQVTYGANTTLTASEAMQKYIFHDTMGYWVERKGGQE